MHPNRRLEDPIELTSDFITSWHAKRAKEMEQIEQNRFRNTTTDTVILVVVCGVLMAGMLVIAYFPEWVGL